MPNLNDSELSQLLEAEIDDKTFMVLIIANKFHINLYLSIQEGNECWKNLGMGELGEKTRAILKNLVKKKKVAMQETNVQNLLLVKPNSGIANLIERITIIDEWIKKSQSITTGRNGEVKAETKFKVACAAAWRCQFEGCGEDLRQHLMPGMSGNYSYYAHIVASSKEGPRGNDYSEALADDPNNIMLLCDKCHRLIDRVAPNDYDADRLREMRQRNVNEVHNLLECLKMPNTEMVVIGGMIEGQAFNFDSRVAQEAMWLRKIKSTNPTEYFINSTSYFSASNNSNYWANAFELLRSTDIPKLKSFLRGTGRNEEHKPLAIFPLHGTSILILAGRLIGDSYPVHLFQFQRQQLECKGRQWAWPDIQEPPSDKFIVQIIKEYNPKDSEAILQINLTARVPVSDLPEQFIDQDGLKLPAIELFINDCNVNAISHPRDLELFGKAVDSVYQKIQDEWRIKIVHLFVIAPTTACVRIGQKMQARHQADFILYERKPSIMNGVRGFFEPTIKISSTKVTSLSNNEQIDIY